MSEKLFMSCFCCWLVGFYVCVALVLTVQSVKCRHLLRILAQHDLASTVLKARGQIARSWLLNFFSISTLFWL